MSVTSGPPTDLKTVVDRKSSAEWHFPLQLRDAVLKLRRDGAFVAVPLFRVNTGPVGPHPVGSYEIWAPSETFASVFSYLCLNRGNLSILVHPLTRDQRSRIRNAWLGPSFPLDLSTLPVRSDEIPLQYKLGYSGKDPLTIPQRLKKEAARAPPEIDYFLTHLNVIPKYGTEFVRVQKISM
ncbi:DOPA-like domain-containing protein [Pholiota molesta]|nr:DOPA-like domain-containing protein [Pholiota molesta]